MPSKSFIYGGAKDYEAQSPNTAGVKGTGSSQVFDALSCYLSLSFKHSDPKRG